MQKTTLKISNFLIDRVYCDSLKVSWLLSLKENPSISIDYINFSSKIEENNDFLIEELNLLNILLPGNVIPNGILIIDPNFLEEKPKIFKKIEENEKIMKIFDFFSELPHFHIVVINPNDLTKNSAKILRKNKVFEDFSIEIIKEDELKEFLKDYFFMFSELKLEISEKNQISDDFLKNASFVKFNNSEIVAPVDLEKKYRYFEVKTKSLNVNNGEIVRDKWKALLKQIKSDSKKVNFFFFFI